MWRGNQYLELQKWEDFIYSNKIIILSIIMSVPKKNQQGYKENVNEFITFDFEKLLQ